jgi:hypothetical protein
MTKILVSGVIANKPFNGGAAWTRLVYVLGLRKLGFDPYFVEKINPAAFIDIDGNPVSAIEASINRKYFRRIAADFGLTDRMALISSDLRTVEGVAFEELMDIAGSADLLLNISGHLDLKPIIERVARKAYIDLDPGFTQFWHAEGTGNFRLADHDYYFTVGENIGAHDCLIPSNGIHWRRTRPPVLLDLWPMSNERSLGSFTTIATWRGPFGPVSAQGRTFGSKVHEFRKYIEMPARTNASFEIVLNIHGDDQKDREMLRRNAWRIVDPKQAAPDPFSFRKYIQSSGAEFSVAQQMYVDTKSGWFSDRTVRYLAAGKPVLVQDTGFSRNYPVGSGLLAFKTPEEAVAGVHDIREHYSEHAAAARRIAEEYFDSNRVLAELLSEVL